MPAPIWFWAKSAGSAGWDYAGLDYGSSSISTDQAGNSYIVGRHAGPLTKFGTGGPTLATSIGNVFVAKYNPNGICLWARQFGGNDPDIYGNKGEAIDIDAAGNCYATGTFRGSAGSTIIVGPGVTLTGTGFRQIFVVKYSPAGTALWARQPAGAIVSNHYAKSIATDSSGNSYITGYLGATAAQFGGTTLSGVGAFVVKYNPNGTVLWAVMLGGSGDIDGAAIDVNAGGSAYVTGYFQSGIGLRDLFLAAVSPTGVLLWIRQYGSSGNIAYGRGISIDMYGNVFMTGDFDKRINFQGIVLTVGGTGNREAFVVKCNLNGTPIWAKQSTNSQRTQGTAIKATGVGECYVAGSYLAPASANFTPVSLLSNGSTCTFVLRFGVTGSPIWGLSSTNLNTGETPMGISYDASMNIYIAGNVQGPAKFGGNTVIAYGGIDAFVAKLGIKGAAGPLPDPTSSKTVRAKQSPKTTSRPKKTKPTKR